MVGLYLLIEGYAGTLPIVAVLRPFSEEEAQELYRVSRASSEPRNRHQRAGALLAVAEGKSLSEAARLVGWKSHDPVTRLTRRFNLMGLSALDDLPRSGAPRTYGAAERARILQEARRKPDRKEDATATWSFTLLQRALREASDGLSAVSTFTILHTLHEAGYSWQKDRSWCHTGRTLKNQNPGVGSLLYEHIITALQPLDPLYIRKRIRADNSAGASLLRMQGFQEERRIQESCLDLAQHDFFSHSPKQDEKHVSQEHCPGTIPSGDLCEWRRVDAPDQQRASL